MGKFTKRANIFYALSVEQRLELLELLQRGQKYSSELNEQLGVSLDTVLNHMRIMEEAGLVHAKKEGTRLFYSLNTECTENLTDILNELLTVKPGASAPKKTRRRVK
jgi:predicted transcriptional regulator